MTPVPAAPLATATSRLEPWQATIGEIEVTFGPGRLAELGALARAAGIGRPLLVTDPGLVAAGHAARAREALVGAGLAVELFAAVDGEPDEATVAAGTRAAAAHRPDGIVALGGGSALDAAKGINFLVTNGGRMSDYWGYGKARRPLLPAIGVPATAGTGSDAQSYALISQAETGRKMACGDPTARFAAVLLDPEVAATAPPEIAAAAALDAMAHALESLVSRRRTEASADLSRRAFDTLKPAMEPLASGGGLRAVARLLLGAHLAGAAVERSMLGAAHAAANPLSARYRVPHAHAVALVLPAVLRFNADSAADHYREVEAGGGKALARWIEARRGEAGLPARLRDVAVPAGDLAGLAELACAEWTGSFNPRPADRQAFLEIYEQTY